MKVLRGLLALLGTTVVVFGLAVAIEVVPPIAAIQQDAVDYLGTDYLLIAAVGGVAAVVTLLVGAALAVSSINQLEMPDPEGVPGVPRPGDAFEGFINRPPWLKTHLLADEPDRVQNRLREAAIKAVMHQRGCAREAARRRVASGAWTDDVEAAAYLGETGTLRPPWQSRLRAALRGRTWAQRGARRTAAAIVELSEGESR